MRLIDADEIVNTEFLYINNKIVIEFLKDVVGGWNTVEAIPIEWIKSKKTEITHEKYDYVRGCQEGFNDCIDYLISEWEKENEISTMPASDNSTIPLDYLGERK